MYEKCAEGRGRKNLKQKGQSRSYTLSDAEAGKVKTEHVGVVREEVEEIMGSQIITNFGSVVGFMVFTLSEK